MRDLVILWLVVVLGMSSRVIDLNGAEWRVSREGSPKYRASVPGQIHTDLMANEVIGDPYYGWQVDEMRWIPES